MDALHDTARVGAFPAKGAVAGRTEGALEPAGAGGLMNDVCDPPNVYSGAGAPAAVTYVQDTHRERTYEPVEVQKTIVQHDVERVKPVLHQEEHQTRLHEVVHHKYEGARDQGITNVVRHGDADPCGNPVSGVATTGLATNSTDYNTNTNVMAADPAATNIANESAYGTTNTTDAYGTTGATGATGYGTTDAQYGTTGTTGTTTGTTGTTGYGSSAYGSDTAVHKEPKGVKGLINKIVPGPGPFK